MDHSHDGLGTELRKNKGESAIVAKNIDQAAENHTTCKVKSRIPPPGKIVFSKPDGKNLQMSIVNSPIGYPPDVRQGFGEMIQVLQAEGKLFDSGSIPIASLEAM